MAALSPWLSGAAIACLRLPTQLARAATVSGANEREQDNYAQMLLQLEASISQARAARHARASPATRLTRTVTQALRDIDGLKVELEVARTERKHKEEYEVRFCGHVVSYAARGWYCPCV